MKKYLILGLLFIMPISAYLFFASGVNQFERLPVITEKVNNLPQGENMLGKNLDLNGKITILGFPGKNLFETRGDAFNLNQKIYKRYKDFEDFQLIMVVPKDVVDESKLVVEELAPISDMSNWNYLYVEEDSIKNFFKGLGTVSSLDGKLGTPLVFLIDKDLSLRGRKGVDENGKQEYKEGYSIVSPAELNNIMMDDVKVLLAEYRLALKKDSKKNKE